VLWLAGIVCVMPTPRRERLTLEDLVEIIDCKAYYEHSSAPMNFYDLAFVFECSVQTVKRIFNNTHPLMVKHNMTVEKPMRNIPRPPLPGRKKAGRPKGSKDKVPRKRAI